MQLFEGRFLVVEEDLADLVIQVGDLVEEFLVMLLGIGEQRLVDLGLNDLFAVGCLVEDELLHAQ